MSIKRVALWGSAGLVLAAVLLVPALLAGVRMFAVQTPSMGQVAPVGTLVVTTRQSAYVAGDVISFNVGQLTHTHRIVRVQADGTFITKGDLNGAEDPLPAAPGDVIGKATAILPGVGWLIAGLPWLLLGSIAVHLLTLIGKLPPHVQAAIRISGTTLIFSLVVLWLRPWLNVGMLGFTPVPDGNGVLMHVVNTGLFPLDALGTRLVSGQDAVVQVVQAAGDGRYVFTPTPSLEWWQAGLLILVCLLPLVASLLIRVEDQPGTGLRAVRNPVSFVVAIVMATTLVVAGFTLPKAFAATTAKVQNTVSTAGSRTFFNCRNAVTSSSSSKFFAFALGTATATETDLSGNGRTGRYVATAATSTSRGCSRDTPARSVTFNGTSQCLYMNSATNTSQNNPNTFSIEAWFRTSKLNGNGRIIGFGNSRNTAGDTNYDRHIYLDKDGRIVFGVWPNAVKMVYTAAGTDYADNTWHHVVGTLSSAGQKLYVDGDLVMTNAAVTTAEGYTGYWKVGCGNLASWQNAATYASGSTSLDYNGPSYFSGQIQYAAVYTVALSASQVKEHYQAG